MGTSMLLDGSLGTLNETQNDVIKTIREDEDKLSTLVHELLELSKIESDKAIFNFRECSMENIIVASIKQYFDQSKEKGINLVYEITDVLPAIKADPEKITWVINNLIANALKYTEKGDSITVRAGIAEDKVQVSVSDTGIGIPPEFVNKIFGKFVQVQGYDREVRGTGLGLAIVKDIIDAHGGDIWCTSKLDEGSIFTFTLPIH
jgi:signal transduction histidine kinase